MLVSTFGSVIHITWKPPRHAQIYANTLTNTQTYATWVHFGCGHARRDNIHVATPQYCHETEACDHLDADLISHCTSNSLKSEYMGAHRTNYHQHAENADFTPSSPQSWVVQWSSLLALTPLRLWHHCRAREIHQQSIALRANNQLWRAWR